MWWNKQWCFSFCSFNGTVTWCVVSVVSWRYSDITKGNGFSCHYQTDCVTNLGTTVGHYTNNSYVCTLELLIYMSSSLHRHTLNRPHFRIWITLHVCVFCAACPWPVICLWLALTHAWGSQTVGVPTGALSIGGCIPTEEPFPRT